MRRSPALVALGLAVAILATGCAPRPPHGDPHFPGVAVLSVNPDGRGYGSVLVDSSGSGMVSVNITAGTEVLLEAGGAYEQATFSDIAPSQTLDVWTKGQIAESYPVQAWATAVVIRAVR